MRTLLIVSVIIYLTFSSGCTEYETSSERWKRENDIKRYNSLFQLECADSLDDFLELEKESYLDTRLDDDEDISPKRRQWYADNTPDLKPSVKEAILKGNIFIGMTKQEVQASWGLPNDINRTVYSSGVHEQWVYYDGGTYVPRINQKYIYFNDGIVTSWQD